jgi:hypothetical protein
MILTFLSAGLPAALNSCSSRLHARGIGTGLFFLGGAAIVLKSKTDKKNHKFITNVNIGSQEIDIAIGYDYYI